MAMKVPTYRSQAQLSGKSGGIQFGVNASPEGFSQSARAQTNLFATMEKAATGFLEAETKAQREAELVAAQNSWNTQNQTDTIDLNKMSSADIVSTYGTRQKTNTTTVSSGIKDKVVRKRFDTWAASAKVESDANVNKIYRSKWVDEGVASYNKKIDFFENQLLTGNKQQQAQANIALYGNPVTGKSGIYGEMTQLGFLSEVDAQKDEKKSKSRVIAGAVRRDLSKFNSTDDSAGARAYYTGLMDPNDGRFVNLDPAIRQSLADKALTLSEQIDRSIIARDRATAAADEKKRTTKHRVNEASFLTSIAASRVGESGSAETAPSEPVPTMNQIIEAFENDEIDRGGYNNIMKALTGDDAIKDNPIVLTEILDKLDNAETPAEVDAAMKFAAKKIGIVGGLTLNTYQGLSGQAQQFKDKTPHAVASKRYANALRTSIGESVQRTYTGRDANPERDRRAAEAVTYYYKRVNDPKNPVTPQVAYRETLRNWQMAKQDDLVTTAPSQRVIASWNNLSGGGTQSLPLDVRKWTPSDYDNARAAIGALPSRKDNPQNGLSPIEKVIENEKLDVLEDNAIFIQELKARREADRNNDAGSDMEETSDQQTNWWDVITGRGNNEETVDDVRGAN